jgi:type IV pilus assembly protein PilY1
LLIVISDGEWDDNPDSLAAELAGLGIQTFAVGFSVESSSSASAKYISLSQSAGTYPTSPIFTDSAQTVYESISDYILQNLSSTLTFSAPTIMPEVSGDDYIVQATFKYKTNHQWKGHLNKYDLNADGNIGSIQWDAGEKLAAKKAKNRKIWTVGDNLALDEDYNNFTTDNLNALEPLLLENNTASYLGEEESNEDNLKNLIDFVRGVDVYGEFSGGVDDEGDKIIEGERWKLADIYHSRAVVVGVPDAFSSKDSAANTESYYRYSYGYDSFKTDNVATRDTVVYVGSNSGMLHAFDAETGEEKWAFVMPGLIPNLKDMISTVSGESVSIFGVDGSPVAKDIFVNGAWKTILIVGSAQGGKTYSILDITDPENPGHIFSFAHNSITEMVIIWDENGQRTEYSTDPEISSIPDAYDFSKLGEAWSNPLILRLPVGAEGAMRWVALFGGGFNAGISTEYGAQLYILDLEDGGKIIKNLNISDDDSSDGVENSVPARLMAVTPDSSTQFQGDDDPSGAVIYFSDLEGKLWKINLTTQGQLYQFAQLFDAETTASNARLSFHEITATLDDDGNLWQYYGTGDVLSLGDVSSSIANRGYGYRHITPMTDFSQSAMDTVSSPFMANVGLNECPQPPTGWFIDLDPNEKITAKASIANGYVYFSRYTSNADDICTAGTAKVTEHDYVCGNVITEFDLGNGVPTETLVYNNKIYLGISTDQVSANLPEGWTKVGNLLTATVTNPSFGSVNVESWWEER